MTDGKKLNDGDLWEEFYTNLHHAHHALRKAFVESGLTQDQLAARLGVDKSLISKRLNGNDNLTLRTLSFMASALGCRLRIEPIPYDQVLTAGASVPVVKHRKPRKVVSMAE